MAPHSDGGALRAPRLDAVANALAATRVGVWSWEVASGAVRWSPEVEAMFGLPPGGFGDTFDGYLARVLPDDLERLNHFMHERIVLAEAAPDDETRRTFVMEHRIRKVDDSLAWLEARGHIDLDTDNHCRGLAGIIVDVTARKLADEALRLQAEEYRLFTELASDYVYSAEFVPDGPPRTHIVAGSFERTTGHTFEGIERQGGWAAILHPDDRPAILALGERLLAGESLVNEYRVLDPAGDVRWLRDHVRPVKDGSGKVVRFVGGVTDITQRKRLETELVQARKLEAIGRLAGAVAHDFNNLLTVVLNSSELLVRDYPELADNQDIKAISEASERGGELTRSLLTIARRQVDVATPISVGDMLLGSQPIISRALGDRIALAIGVPDVALSISVDRGQAHILLLNLAMNARDAMPAGGTFKLAVTRLMPGAGPRPAELGPGEYVVINASDDGVGIAPETVPYLFEPFFTTKADGKGTGLGLATCHGIARAAGGTITVESQLGRGATFRVYLPATALVASPARAPIVSERGGRETVLIVEDGTALRTLIARDLRGRGYTVLAAASAEEARPLFSESARIDLALLDIGLPGMSGAELALLMRKEQPTTHVILMSGNPGDDETHTLVQAGVPFLQKPFSTRVLGELLRRVLDEPLQRSR